MKTLLANGLAILLLLTACNVEPRKGELQGADQRKPMGTIVVYGKPTAGGHVAGGGTYPFKTPVQISGNPNTGWSLQSWNDGVTNEVRTVVVPNGTVTYTATFIQNAPPPVTNSLVTVCWIPAPSATSYQVFQGTSPGSYTNQWPTTATNLQINVPPKITSYIAVKSVGSTGLVSTNYSNELAYTAP